MRIVRVSESAPEGSPLELHPQLTILLGAPPTVVHRIEQAFRCLFPGAGRGGLVDGDPAPLDRPTRAESLGEIEVHGIRMAVEPRSAQMLGVDRAVDPVVRLASVEEHRGGREALEVADVGSGAHTSPVLDDDPDDPIVERLAMLRIALNQLQPEPDSDLTPADRSRRDELRCLEAELLDHLGFDSIDWFIEHSPENRARLDRATSIAGGLEPWRIEDLLAGVPPTHRSQNPEEAPRSDPVGMAPSPSWRLLERIAQQRSVGHVGSVPLLVEGLVGPAPGQSPAGSSGSPEDSAALIDEIGRMAGLVQIVATSNDATVASWAAALGPSRASVVCW